MPQSKLEKTEKIRIIFMGTPDFAVPGFSRLINEPSFEVVAVLTQPDKPIGRKQIMTPPAIKKIALENNITVFQPTKIKDELENIEPLKPDLIVVIAYGKIIPQSILDIPKYGCVNVHASLLPKYRGAACLNAPILNGDEETGITIMKMEAGLDTGPILRQAKIKLSGNETLEYVHDNLSALGSELLVPTLKDFVAGKIIPEIQDDSKASYVSVLKKTDGKIDWSKSANEIERVIRAFNPWPGTYGLSDGKIVKIISVEKEILNSNDHKTGETYLTEGNLAVQCGQDSLVILKLQLEGKKIMTSEEFLRGHKLNTLG